MITVYREVEVEVDIDASDFIDDLSPSEKNELASILLKDSVPGFPGEGDLARVNNIIERAYNAAKSLPAIPREIADMFWHVHGRALP